MGSGIGKRIQEMNRTNNGALARIEAVESQNKQIIAALNQSLAAIEQRLRGLEEALEATVECVGVESVQDAIEDIRQRKAEMQAEFEKQSLQKAIDDGRAVPAEIVGEQTLIVGREYDANGKVLPGGRVQLFFSQIVPDMVDVLKGKTVGTVLDLPAGGKFEILEIYGLVKKDAAPATAESPPASEAPVDITAELADAPAAAGAKEAAQN